MKALCLLIVSSILIASPARSSEQELPSLIPILAFGEISTSPDPDVPPPIKAKAASEISKRNLQWVGAYMLVFGAVAAYLASVEELEREAVAGIAFIAGGVIIISLAAP